METKSLGQIRDPRDMVEEYETKLSEIPNLIADHNASINAARAGTSIGGASGRESIFCCSVPSLSQSSMKAALLKSAWWAVYKSCNMDILATAKDKKEIEEAFQNPVPFTVSNIEATFGPYLVDQRMHILRGLAEAFIELDDAYKSHSKVKIGVKGLPKRVIINNAKSEWGRAWGWQRAEDMINALHVFNGFGIVDRNVMWDIQKEKILNFHGLEFRWFKNGNLHIYFNQDACRQINLGLAEFYGDVLPDVEPDKDDLKPDLGKTEVSKDLQYYPTPEKVADLMLRGETFYDGDDILEPSCGCGRIMQAVKKTVMDRRGFGSPPANMSMRGIEYDIRRVRESRFKGYHVTHANFLEVGPKPIFNKIYMNPPFYGKHYLKHILHAIRFRDPKRHFTMISILPATAHYDHKLLPDGYRWTDLPVGSFAASGTRVPTGYAKWSIRAEE